MLSEIYNYMVLISPIVLTIIGIIGNSFVIYILTRPKLLKESMFRYFLITEVINMISLIDMYIWYIPYFLGWDMPPQIFCKLVEYISYIIYSMYPWLNALNSVDRLLAFKYSTRFLLRKKFKFQALAASSMLFISFITNSPFFIFFESSNVSTCVIPNHFTSLYVYSVFLTIVDIIPFSIMIISTSSILQHLISNKRRLQRSNNSVNFKREAQFAKSIFVMDVWQLVCVVPFSIVNLIQASLEINGKHYDYWLLLHDSLYFLLIIQTSCNFFVFIFCNNLFRKEFCSLFSCCQKKTRTKTVVNNKNI